MITPDFTPIIQLKVLDPRIENEFGLPEYQTEHANALDLVACIDEPITLKPGENVLISAGISIWTNSPYIGTFLIPRSGNGHKKGLILANGTGLLDGDYQGPVYISAWNRKPNLLLLEKDSQDDKENEVIRNDEANITIEPGERLAQMFFTFTLRPQFEKVAEFDEVTKRAEGGFGHTGKN